jgi:DNA repair photolyase
MAPILPGISDAPAQLEATVAAAAAAGAAFVWANPVYLKPGTREYFFDFLDREYPHLRPSYDRLIPDAYVPARYKAAVQEQVGRLRDQHRVGTEPRPARIQPVRPTQLALIP